MDRENGDKKKRTRVFRVSERRERDDENRVKESEEDLVVERVMRIGTHMSCNGQTIMPFFSNQKSSPLLLNYCLLSLKLFLPDIIKPVVLSLRYIVVFGSSSKRKIESPKKLVYSCVCVCKVFAFCYII